MKIVVIGASRGVGRCIVELALSQGHHVTAAVRDPSSIRIAHERLRIVRCDVLDTAAVGEAIAGQDAVLCTLGTSDKGPVTLYSTGARNIVLEMKKQRVRRLVFLSNFGVLGERAKGLRTNVLLFLVKRLLHRTVADHRRALDLIQEHAPEWVAVRPLPLTHSNWTGSYRVAVEGIPDHGTRIARADVADFMLRQASSDAYLYKIPSIAY